MNKKKILSLIMALVMLVGVFSPLTALAAGDTTNTVTLHKLVMSKDELGKWDKAFSDGLEKKGYDGTQNTKQLKDLLGAGHSAHEVAGVYFAVKYNSGDNNGKYVTIKEEAGKDPVYGAVDTLDATLENGFKLLAGKTEANGIVFNTKGLSGDFLIEEIHEKSSYVGDGGEAITDSKAVPVEITLPLVNNDGVVENAHVYPKNTEEKPEIDKNFLKNNDLTAAEKEAADKLKVGADYNNYQEKKATAKAEIGKKIPYEVKTKIPAKSKLKTAYWSDEMTEGLEYNGDLKVTIGGKEADANDYKVTTDSNVNGFRIELTEAGFKKVNEQDKDTEVVLTYSATVKSITVVDIPEANDITFHYGNNKPGKGNTPIPTKPNDNGELTVKKTWADGTPAAGEWATFKLVNAQTGEEIGTVRFATEDNAGQLKTTTTYTPNAAYKPIGNEKTITGPSTKTEAGNEWSFTWTGLDKEIQYKVVEDNNMNQTAHFTKGENGEILITNNKDNNPKPLNPTEPKVVTGGKRFVKTNQDGSERLAGAEFYVKNSKGEYLVPTLSEGNDVATKKATLDEKVKAYNELSADDQAGTKGTEAKKAIDDAQDAYNKAFKAAATKYEFKAKEGDNIPANAVVLTSDSQGRFEITGLEYGDYKLEEKTAPKGFAKLNGDIDFKVAKGSYTKAAGYEDEKTEPKHIGYNNANDTVKGQEVVNKKVSIPQTGGMGTVLFTIVGISLMAGAVVAMKRNREEA
ncbi:pilin N-terminal domain-containing protein [Peptoniphilus harei]|uniref:pilin N-terminal domain-containing protein n=1 Tax=Peptoniphilus harei TaxID=54005 RepID=UPI0029137CBA|nr:pilin N-terminal domain-containing protein [Peptoniphilus harei]MDU5417636.1 pilin N-terminal domain-containing protein [Peptoniphilus harei]